MKEEQENGQKQEKKGLKKILIVTAFPTEGAGSGTLITTQAKSYIKRGYDVEIITANNRTNFKKIPGVNYVVVPFTGETENPEVIPGQLPFNYPMYKTHTESKGNFWNLDFDQVVMYTKKFKEIIDKEVKKFQPDVIHAQHLWIASDLCTKTDYPTIITIHGTDLMGYEKSLKALEQIKDGTYEKNGRKLKESEINDEIKKYQTYIASAKESAKNAQRIIVISNDQKKQFEKLFPEASDKVEFIKNGYSPDVFYKITDMSQKEIKEKAFEGLYDQTEKGEKTGREIPKDFDNLILFVGKFADFKGIDDLISAEKKYSAEFEKEGKKVITVIVGSGDQGDKLREQAKDSKNIYFVGRQPQDKINLLQNCSTISCIPSRDEPFGLVVIEGTATGHPVIGTESGGIPDIMASKEEETVYKNGNNYVKKVPLGYMIPKDSPESLAEAVERIVNEKDKFNNQEIAEYTKQNYNQDVITDQILEAFNDTIQTKKRDCSNKGGIKGKKNKENDGICL